MLPKVIAQWKDFQKCYYQKNVFSFDTEILMTCNTVPYYTAYADCLK